MAQRGICEEDVRHPSSGRLIVWATRKGCGSHPDAALCLDCGYRPAPDGPGPSRRTVRMMRLADQPYARPAKGCLTPDRGSIYRDGWPSPHDYVAPARHSGGVANGNRLNNAGDTATKCVGGRNGRNGCSYASIFCWRHGPVAPDSRVRSNIRGYGVPFAWDIQWRRASILTNAQHPIWTECLPCLPPLLPTPMQGHHGMTWCGSTRDISLRR